MAQADFILDIQTIRGETKNEEIPQGIEVKGFSFSIVAPASLNRRTGATRLSNVSVRKVVDASSTALMQACLQNKAIAEAVLICHKAGGKQEPYFEIIMEDARIQSVTTRADGPVVEEIVAIGFGSIEWRYSEQSKDGRLLGGNSVVYHITTDDIG
jgi:type VI secretion system secreted protein Hcp